MQALVLTAVALLMMPLLGRVKHMLAARLGSAATAGEGTQNYLCAAQAAAVLAITAAWPGGWWIDPVIGLALAAIALREAPDPGGATIAADRGTPDRHPADPMAACNLGFAVRCHERNHCPVPVWMDLACTSDGPRVAARRPADRRRLRPSYRLLMPSNP